MAVLVLDHDHAGVGQRLQRLLSPFNRGLRIVAALQHQQRARFACRRQGRAGDDRRAPVQTWIGRGGTTCERVTSGIVVADIHPTLLIAHRGHVVTNHSRVHRLAGGNENAAAKPGHEKSQRELMRPVGSD